MNYQMWKDMLRTPFGYGKAIEVLRKNMLSGPYKDRLKEYVQQKSALGLTDAPKQITSKISETEKIENSIMLKQAEYFGKLAKESPPEVKPLLYHYAENALFGFFVYSLFPYTSHAKNHGLNTNFNGNVNDNNIEFHKGGFFPRIVDVYHLLEVDTDFSPIIYRSDTGHSETNPSNISITQSPKLTLEQTIEMKSNLNNLSEENKHDIIDFLLLFIASNMSRYRPSIWSNITEGKDGPHIVWFNQCFDRFDFLYERLLGTMYDISKGFKPNLRLLQRNCPPH